MVLIMKQRYKTRCNVEYTIYHLSSNRFSRVGQYFHRIEIYSEESYVHLLL